MVSFTESSFHSTLQGQRGTRATLPSRCPFHPAQELPTPSCVWLACSLCKGEWALHRCQWGAPMTFHRKRRRCTDWNGLLKDSTLHAHLSRCYGYGYSRQLHSKCCLALAFPSTWTMICNNPAFEILEQIRVFDFKTWTTEFGNIHTITSRRFHWMQTNFARESDLDLNQMWSWVYYLTLLCLKFFIQKTDYKA